MKYLLQPIQKFILVALSAPLFLGLGQVPTGSGRLPSIGTISEAVHLPTIGTVQASTPKPASVVQSHPVVKPKGPLHAYPAYGIDPATIVDNTHITAVYFVPADQVGGQYTDWQKNMKETIEAIKSYIAREFDGRLTVSYSIQPVIVGDHALTEYDAVDSPGTFSMYREITAKIGWLAIQNEQRAQGRYPVLMIYYHTGFEERYQKAESRFGAIGLLATAFMPAFELEDGMITGPNQLGLLVSAHEFAHLLGVPHPWEMEPAVADSPDNLMGYQAHGRLYDSHILAEIKAAMGWSLN